MDNFNLVGDMEGRLKTLEALLEKMPKDATLLALGDVVDRGPQGRGTIEFLMKNGVTIQSNHQHMMTEAYKQAMNPGAHPEYYDRGLWPYRNGGMVTIESYGATDDKSWAPLIPKEHIDFLESCPLYVETENFIMTHAPIRADATLAEATDLGEGFANPYRWDHKAEGSVLWNRQVPHRQNKHLGGKINVFGHNSSNKPKLFTEEFPHGIKVDQAKLTELLANREHSAVWAMCIDTSAAKVLTGLHLPTMTLYTQEFID